MTTPASLLAAPRSRRPPPVVATISVLGFLGVTAVGGGVELVVFRRGGPYTPSEWLERIPVLDTFLVPGIVLGAGFGAGSLATAYGMLRQPSSGPLRRLETRTGRHWSWGATVGLGGAFALWLLTELTLLGGPAGREPDDRVAASVTYAVFGSVAAALLTLPQLRSVRAHLALEP